MNPGATVREAGDVRGTVREGEDGRAPNQPNQVLLRLPSALADRFEVEREMRTRGNEADILVARDRSSGENVAIKLYRPGIAPKPEVIQLLASLDTNYVVRQLESGSSEGRAYEVMELAEGSLADLLVERKGKLTDTQLRSVIEQVTAHLEYIHGLQPKIVHRDIKPDNILMRTRKPLKFVLTDFGISSIVEHGSRVASSVHRTTFYAAPEAGAGDVSAGLDWWSLGMIVAEAAGGQHPFGDAHQQTVNIHFARREPIPLGAVTDPRVKLLCQGLLCYDQKQRWGAAEVRRWLIGDPTLKAPTEAPARPVAGERAARAYRIGGTDCWTLAELAAALVANWDEAVKRVARRNDIERWLLQDLQDQDAYNRFLDLNEDQAYQSLPPSAKLSLWLPMLDPTLPPMVEGAPLTEARILNLLSAAAHDSTQWPPILQPGYAEQLAELGRVQWLADTYAAWNAAAAEARSVDDRLCAAAGDMAAINASEQLPLLRLVLDRQFREDTRARLAEAARERNVRACTWAAVLIKIDELSPAGLWLLDRRLADIRISGQSAALYQQLLDDIETGSPGVAHRAIYKFQKIVLEKRINENLFLSSKLSGSILRDVIRDFRNLSKTRSVKSAARIVKRMRASAEKYGLNFDDIFLLPPDLSKLIKSDALKPISGTGNWRKVCEEVFDEYGVSANAVYNDEGVSVKIRDSFEANRSANYMNLSYNVADNIIRWDNNLSSLDQALVLVALWYRLFNANELQFKNNFRLEINNYIWAACQLAQCHALLYFAERGIVYVDSISNVLFLESIEQIRPKFVVVSQQSRHEPVPGDDPHSLQIKAKVQSYVSYARRQLSQFLPPIGHPEHSDVKTGRRPIGFGVGRAALRSTPALQPSRPKKKKHWRIRILVTIIAILACRWEWIAVRHGQIEARRHAIRQSQLEANGAGQYVNANDAAKIFADEQQEVASSCQLHQKMIIKDGPIRLDNYRLSRPTVYFAGFAFSGQVVHALGVVADRPSMCRVRFTRNRITTTGDIPLFVLKPALSSQPN